MTYAAVLIKNSKSEEHLRLINFDGTSEDFIAELHDKIGDSPEFWSSYTLVCENKNLQSSLIQSIKNLIDSESPNDSDE